MTTSLKKKLDEELEPLFDPYAYSSSSETHELERRVRGLQTVVLLLYRAVFGCWPRDCDDQEIKPPR